MLKTKKTDLYLIETNSIVKANLWARALNKLTKPLQNNIDGNNNLTSKLIPIRGYQVDVPPWAVIESPSEAVTNAGWNRKYK